MEGKDKGERKKRKFPMGKTSRGMLEPLNREEKMMAPQNKADKKKNEINCQRCNGRMAFEKFYGENGSFFGWHCVMCGDILDSVILLHRLSHDAALTIPEKEEELMSLVRKYIKASPKMIKVQNGER
jgi:late competence protein required for DNA uptake (superfamily II DNA/RNA helicase)